ncbi:MAG: UDP-2,3-diacylglucosamine diphosphatase [Bacteroidota bacterium]
MTERKHIYFASDFHLGYDDQVNTRRRERIIVDWLEEIRTSAKAIYLVGDVFDYWFEYKWTIPKGYVRLLGTLAKLVDSGVEIHFLKGNHDMWVYQYFAEEIGMIIHDDTARFEDSGKHFFVDHGDGLGRGERRYKLVRGILRNRFLQRSFARIHPSWGLRLMRKLSAASRARHSAYEKDVHELPIRFANELLGEEQVDFFIMGHRHQAVDRTLANGYSRYINLGDWVTQNTYVRWDGDELELLSYQSTNQEMTTRS